MFLVPRIKETLPGSLGDLSWETRGTEYTALVSVPKVLFVNTAPHSSQLETGLDGSTYSISMAKKTDEAEIVCGHSSLFLLEGP